MDEAYAQIVVSMPWSKKLRGLPEKNRAEALGFYAAACCYCQDNLTDGRIDRDELVKVFPAPKHVERLARLLVDATLMEFDGETYEIHDYLDYNRSRAEVEQLRAVRKAAGSAGGRASAQAKRQASAVASAQANPKQSSTQLTANSYQLKDKPLSLEIPESVLGYWTEKSCREPSDAELRSLRVLCKAHPAHVVELAIGQACAQGESPDNFALITTIAKSEGSRS